MVDRLVDDLERGGDPFTPGQRQNLRAILLHLDTFIRTVKWGFVIVGALAVLGGAASTMLWFQLQDQRRESVRDGCTETNGRAHNFEVKLTERAKQIKDPQARARALAQIPLTLEFIHTLAPVQNCEALVKRRVHTTFFGIG